MSKAAVVDGNDGYTVVVGPISTRIVEDGSNTDHHMGAVVITIAPRSPGPPPHVHRKHDEGFLVISGRVRFTMGEEFRDVGAGQYVAVPRDAAHTFSNPFDDQAVMFNIMTPDLYIPYFHDLKQLQDGVGLDPQAVLKIMANYATEPAGRPANA